jgi:Arc/MetJ-type ribon-helix-helix transcriptional regulator
MYYKYNPYGWYWGGKNNMADTEKITINMNVVDLGNIDLLVEQGFYSNRTDFIKTAIRSQLEKHSAELKDAIIRKTFMIGVVSLNRESLEDELMKNNMLEIKVLGMLILKDNISPELADKTIKSIKVLGSFRANDTLKLALKDKIEE